MTARPSSLSVFRSQVREGSWCLSPYRQRRLSVRAQRTADVVAPCTETLSKAFLVRHVPQKIIGVRGAPEGAQDKSKATKAVCRWAAPEGAEIMMQAVALTLPIVGFVVNSKTGANPAVNLAPFGRWTLRDKAAQRRLPLR